MGFRRRRTPIRLAIGALAVMYFFRRRKQPEEPRHILVTLYYEGLGDIILLTPLLARLRARYPEARITLTTPRAYLPLFSGRPYEITAIPYDRRDVRTLWALWRAGPYDLAITPMEARQSWLAYALGARWIRAFAGDRWYYRLPVDERISYPDAIEPFSDMWVRLGPRDPEIIYDKKLWPPPPMDQKLKTPHPYAVFHLGASSPARNWPSECWAELARRTEALGLHVVLTAGPNQADLVRNVDTDGRFLQYPGTLSLATLWRLLAEAQLLVVPDTGVAHLAKLTQTPATVLFGQCDPALYDPGRFWAGMPYTALTVPDLPCRDQVWFARRGGALTRLRRCMRGLDECPHTQRCMRTLSVDAVFLAMRSLLAAAPRSRQG